MNDAHTPQWRDQYAGGLKPDPDVEAALSGAPGPSGDIAFRPAPAPMPTAPSLFGPMVRLR